MQLDVDLELADRQLMLDLEKRLARHHRALNATLQSLGPEVPDRVREDLQASLWRLGATVELVACSHP